MKTAEQIATEVLSKLPTRLKGEIVSWDPLIDTAVIEAMREYAREAVQEFVAMETGEDGCMEVWQMYGIVGISTDQDKLDKFKETL